MPRNPPSAVTSGLKSGDRTVLLHGPVTTGDLVRYAGASGDFNPIHYDHHAALAAGLDGVIAHGLYVMAVAGRVFDSWLTATEGTFQNGWISRFEARFTASVRPGDQLVITAVVTETGPDDPNSADSNRQLVLADVSGHVGDRLVLAAKASLILPLSPDMSPDSHHVVLP